jgi:hypothetical protein
MALGYAFRLELENGTPGLSGVRRRATKDGAGGRNRLRLSSRNAFGLAAEEKLELPNRRNPNRGTE